MTFGVSLLALASMRKKQWSYDYYVILNMISQFLLVGETKSAVVQNA